tara:strand:- start:85 stop:1143 length:1059 start_codon:yes stop_codon:yes gene_type:complete
MGSLRDSGMVQGSKGMGPAGAGGQAKKQGGDGPKKQSFSFNPNIFGPPKQTPKTSLAIPNLGLQFSNPNIGQGITNLGTVNTGAGFNFGGDGAGKQGGLNQVFTPQVGPAPTVNIPAAPPQGIDTLQSTSFGPFQPLTPFDIQKLQALDYLDYYDEDPFSDMDLSAYESNMNFQDMLREFPAVRTAEDLFNTITDPQIETGFGTIGLDLLDQNINLDTGNATINLDLKDDPFLGIKVPLGPQSSLVNPEDTSGIMQASNVLGTTPMGINQLELDEQRKQVMDEINTPSDLDVFNMPTINAPMPFRPVNPFNPEEGVIVDDPSIMAPNEVQINPFTGELVPTINPNISRAFDI